MVLEERMIEGRLAGDVHAVNDVPVWALQGLQKSIVRNGGEMGHCPRQSNE
jgi:hypothetical protein